MATLADRDLRGSYLIIDKLGENLRVYMTNDRMVVSVEAAQAFVRDLIAELS